MSRLVPVGGAILGSLIGFGRAEAMDGQAAGRLSLELVGFLVVGFLFYLAFSGAIGAAWSRLKRQPTDQLAERRGRSDAAKPTPPPRQAGETSAPRREKPRRGTEGFVSVRLMLAASGLSFLAFAASASAEQTWVLWKVRTEPLGSFSAEPRTAIDATVKR